MIRFSPFLAYLVKDLYLVSPVRVFLEWGLALPEYGVFRLTSYLSGLNSSYKDHTA
jgi:hypothetical protein